jgi:hypothetical protein
MPICWAAAGKRLRDGQCTDWPSRIYETSPCRPWLKTTAWKSGAALRSTLPPVRPYRSLPAARNGASSRIGCKQAVSCRLVRRGCRVTGASLALEQREVSVTCNPCTFSSRLFLTTRSSTKALCGLFMRLPGIRCLRRLLPDHLRVVLSLTRFGWSDKH